MTFLSFCIPTYNRASFLTATLDSIASQWAEDLELCVADNASEDDTRDIVLTYKRRLRSVRYFCWDQNQGADRNYLKAVEIATGRYCWLLGSDDTVAPEAVNKVREVLGSRGSNILLCNRLLCAQNMTPRRADRFLASRSSDLQTYDFSRSGTLTQYLRDARSLCATFSYLSSIVVQKTTWDSTPTDSAFFGSVYIHVQKLLAACNRGAELTYIRTPLVHCRLGNDSFRHTGLANRVLIDLTGYDLIATRCFTSEQSVCANRVRRLLRYEYTFWRLLRYQKVLGADPQWPAILSRLETVFGYPRWKLRLATFLGRSVLLADLSFWVRDWLAKPRR